MAQIRGTIELLLKILRENGATKLKAETFRLAKFNNNDVVPCMWKLLFEVIYYSDFGKIDDVCTKACAALTDEEMCIYVKREMQNKGFFSRDFCRLPNDMSSGSREILLAIGWFVCKVNLIQNFMENCTSPLDDDTTSLYESEDEDRELLNELQGNASNISPADKVKQLLWLNNKLRLSLRNLHALHKQKNVLMHRLHESTYGVKTPNDRDHLSMYEVYMLRHPELLKKNIALLEKDNERLQNLLKWKESEDVFWKWMESVLDEKIKNKVDSPGEEADDSSVCLFPETASKLNEAHLNLREAIIKYESIVENLETLWQLKSTEVSDEELDSVLSAIDLELSIQKANIAINNCEKYLQATPNPQFVYKPKKKSDSRRRQLDSLSTNTASAASSIQGDYPEPNTQNKQNTQKSRRQFPQIDSMSPNSASTSTSTQGDIPDVSDICHEIDYLHRMVDSLEKDVEVKQDSFRQEMQSLSAKFRDAICIPPMASKTYKAAVC